MDLAAVRAVTASAGRPSSSSARATGATAAATPPAIDEHAPVQVPGRPSVIRGCGTPGAVSYPQRQHKEFCVPDRVDHAIVANAETPEVGISDEQPSAAGAGIVPQRVNCPDDLASHRLVQLGQFLQCSGVVLDADCPRSSRHTPRTRATSSAGTATARPASRSAKRFRAIRPSS